MDYLYPFFPEYSVKVEILDIQRPANLSRSVVPHPRTAGAVAAVSDIDLVAVPPRSSLRDFRSLEIHPPGAKVRLYESGERASLDKGGQHLDREAKIGRYAGHISLCACGLQAEKVARMDRLSAVRT